MLDEHKRPGIFCILLSLACAFSIGCTSPGRQTAISQSINCGPDALPEPVQEQLKAEYASWKIQDLPDLSSTSRPSWEYKKPAGCPGLAVGRFENTELAYAVLLVPMNVPDQAYRFLVFSTNSDEENYRVTLLGKSDSGGAGNFYITRTMTKEFFDSVLRKRFDIPDSDGIIFVDSSPDEYQARMYFSTSSGYRHEAVDY